jgi:glycine betaine/proline transport system ATP-binding protein
MPFATSKENHDMAKQIIIDRVFKVFGDQPQAALALVHEGAAKQDILARTGCTIGVFDASFTIEAGEIFVIMGLSGSGKSTLVRMLNRLIEPTAGRILVDGDDINTLPDAQLRALRRKDISMVFQSFALLPHVSVLDNTAFGMELAGVPKAGRHALARQALDQVGLGAYAASYPDELSGGMQQRVGLARALACDPSILLMDEAFSALDPIMRTDMQSELLRLQQIKRRTIVFISHDLDEAMRIGDRIAIMKDGHVVQVGTPEEILRRPADDYVRNFVRGVDAAAVFKAGDIARKSQIVVSESPARGSRAALSMLEEQDRAYAYVVNPKQEFLGLVSVDSLRSALDGHTGPLGLAHAFLPDVQTIRADEPVAGLFGQVAQLPYAVPVLADDGRLRGAISKTTLLKFLDRDTPAISEAQTQKGPA